MSLSYSCCFFFFVANDHSLAKMAMANDFAGDRLCLMRLCKVRAWRIDAADDCGEGAGCMDGCLFHQPAPGHHLVMIAFFCEIQSYSDD